MGTSKWSNWGEETRGSLRHRENTGFPLPFLLGHSPRLPCHSKSPSPSSMSPSSGVVPAFRHKPRSTVTDSSWQRLADRAENARVDIRRVLLRQRTLVHAEN